MDDPLVLSILEHIGEQPRYVGPVCFSGQTFMAAPWLTYLGNPTETLRVKLRNGSIYIWDNYFGPIKVSSTALTEKTQGINVDVVLGQRRRLWTNITTSFSIPVSLINNATLSMFKH